MVSSRKITEGPARAIAEAYTEVSAGLTPPTPATLKIARRVAMFRSRARVRTLQNILWPVVAPNSDHTSFGHLGLCSAQSFKKVDHSGKNIAQFPMDTQHTSPATARPATPLGAPLAPLAAVPPHSHISRFSEYQLLLLSIHYEHHPYIDTPTAEPFFRDWYGPNADPAQILADQMDVGKDLVIEWCVSSSRIQPPRS